MNHNDIKRAWHESRNARLALENLLAQAPASVVMECRERYRKENPNRGYWVRLTTGSTASRKPAAWKGTRTLKADARRAQIARCNIKAQMIKRGVS
jgi:hypothetical protein